MPLVKLNQFENLGETVVSRLLDLFYTLASDANKLKVPLSIYLCIERTEKHSKTAKQLGGSACCMTSK